MNTELNIGGQFYVEHYRNGELIGKELSDNLFIDEGLIYALNSAFGVPVGGAPTQVTNLYIGLATSSRNWNSADTGATIHTVSAEFELYSSATRPAWDPQALASSGSIEITDTGFEASYTITDLTSLGGQATITGAFLLTTNDKTADEPGAELIAGSLFATSRVLFEADEFRVGYTLGAASA